MQQFVHTCFHELHLDENMELPSQFTFPFYYEPHKLSIKAAKALQQYLTHQNDFKHNFGLDPSLKGLKIGKMFGIMVVQKQNGTLGYLAAFSGKLAERNDHKGFVPPIFDNLDKNGYYKKGETILNVLNAEIENALHDKNLIKAQQNLIITKQTYDAELKSLKQEIKQKKAERNLKRELSKQQLSNEAYAQLLEDLKQQSIGYHFKLRDLKLSASQHISTLKTHLNTIEAPIEALKQKRAALSAALQLKLHQSYRFLNAKGETKDLLAIFKDANVPPPAGSGECAAPKLFQYAYKNSLTPIAMAEFWWGASPKSEVRAHKQFYPSCRSKCEPILGYMMQGLKVEKNPIEIQLNNETPIEIVYEDDYVMLVNKPHELLSVPGKTTQESVLTKIKRYLPNAKGPILVHRLDMSTSGLLLAAKNEKTYKNLQKQFIARTVKKRYVALLDGVITQQYGTINLPLRVDLDNRPQQLVCYDHGKPATTKFEVIAIKNGITRIHFFPITGRTHQLRVHAAHINGLNTPILGDDLYGKKEKRLYLHAAEIEFLHPVTQQMLKIICEAPF